VSATTNGFHYARRAPDKFGGTVAAEKAFHPWFQVVREFAGQTILVLDFIRTSSMAIALASGKNLQ
jgi:hypothetical protein